MLDTGTLPVFLRAICHVPLMAFLVTLSETICTPLPEAPAEPVVKLVPLEEPGELDT